MKPYFLYVSLYMGSQKPFVEVACICENVIIDKDNSATLVRLVDKFVADMPPNLPHDQVPAFPLVVFVRLKSGAEARSGTATIKVKEPSGVYAPGKVEAKIEFSSPAHGVQFKAELMVVKPVQGLYWLELYWNNEHLTSISADVSVRQAPTQTPLQGS